MPRVKTCSKTIFASRLSPHFPHNETISSLTMRQALSFPRDTRDMLQNLGFKAFSSKRGLFFAVKGLTRSANSTQTPPPLSFGRPPIGIFSKPPPPLSWGGTGGGVSVWNLGSAQGPFTAKKRPLCDENALFRNIRSTLPGPCLNLPRGAFLESDSYNVLEVFQILGQLTAKHDFRMSPFVSL